MAEIITLAAPLDPALTVFRISSLVFDWRNASVKIVLCDWDGSSFGSREVTVLYSGPTATTMMVALNKVNLSTQSLNQRVFARLLADGKIPTGTTGGTVD